MFAAWSLRKLSDMSTTRPPSTVTGIRSEEYATAGWGWRKRTGAIGIGYFVLQVLGAALFMVAGNPPRFDDAKKYADFISSGSGLFLGDAFLTGVATVVFILFALGIRGVIREAGDRWEWVGALAFGAALLLAAIALAGAAFEATTAMVSTTRTDPTTVRAAWVATSLLFTFIYLPSALLLATVSYAALRIKLLPIWAGWLGIFGVVLNLAAVATVFGGTGDYGAVGLLPYVLGFAPGELWVLGVSVALLRAAPATTRPDAAVPGAR
jgi:hypothetical protein